MKGTVERAFELARAGKCADIRDIEKRLKAENYESVLGHLGSPGLRKDLTTLCRAARKKSG